MRSPIRLESNHTSCVSHLKKIIPKRSIVSSFLFFSGETEFLISKSDRFISAHTNNAAVHEFWNCVLTDPQLLYKFISSRPFADLNNKKIFLLLQESWRTYKDPYYRSALFYFLNRASSTGQISSGEHVEGRLARISAVRLKNFKPQNFHLNFFKSHDWVNYSLNVDECDFLFYPMGKFSYNFFEQSKSVGPEETPINHKNFYKTISTNNNRKWIILYKSHKQVLSLYKDFNTVMINKHGHRTHNLQDSEDIIVTNF